MEWKDQYTQFPLPCIRSVCNTSGSQNIQRMTDVILSSSMEDIADDHPTSAVSENNLTQQVLYPFPTIFLKSEIKVSSFLL